MPLDLATFRLVAKPVSLEEGLDILERDHYRCQYCGLDGTASFENALAMSVDFVVPRARKGKKDPRNLVACCRTCNLIKGTRVYRGFDEAKEYVLARRDELRKSWEARGTLPAKAAKAMAAAAGASEAPAKSGGKSKVASASVIGSSPLSLRKG